MKPRLIPPALALPFLLAACTGTDVVDPSPPAPSFNTVGFGSPPTWKVTDISPVPGNSYAWKINDGSEVVGWSTTTTGDRGWFRRLTGAIAWLPLAPRAIGSQAYGISNSGFIVGSMSYRNGISRPAFWPSARSLPVVSDSLPSVNTHAFAVSDQGDVVGWGLDGGGAQVAFLWRPLTAPTGLTRLASFGIQQTQAYDINGRWIVGAANDGVHGLVAVRWRVGGGAPQILSPSGLGFEGRAYGLSPNGRRIVGFDELNPGTAVFGASMWTPPGGESVFGPTSYWNPTELRAVTDSGVAVGAADVNGVATPWVYRDDPTAGYGLTLDVPASQSARALSINKACEIVGWGSGAAWLWVPSRCP